MNWQALESKMLIAAAYDAEQRITSGSAASAMSTAILTSPLPSIRRFSTLSLMAAFFLHAFATTTITSGWPDAQPPDQIKTAPAGRLP